MIKTETDENGIYIYENRVTEFQHSRKDHENNYNYFSPFFSQFPKNESIIVNNFDQFVGEYGKIPCTVMIIWYGNQELIGCFGCTLKTIFYTYRNHSICFISDSETLPRREGNLYSNVIHIRPKISDILDELGCTDRKYAFLHFKRIENVKKVQIADLLRYYYSTKISAMYIDLDTFFLEEFTMEKMISEDCRKREQKWRINDDLQANLLSNGLFNISNTVFSKNLVGEICSTFEPQNPLTIGPKFCSKEFYAEKYHKTKELKTVCTEKIFAMEYMHQYHVYQKNIEKVKNLLKAIKSSFSVHVGGTFMRSFPKKCSVLHWLMKEYGFNSKKDCKISENDYHKDNLLIDYDEKSKQFLRECYEDK